jgi:hypothetical protein
MLSCMILRLLPYTTIDGLVGYFLIYSPNVPSPSISMAPPALMSQACPHSCHRPASASPIPVSPSICFNVSRRNSTILEVSTSSRIA